MQLLIEVSQTLYPSIRLYIKTLHTFFAQDLMQLVAVLLQELLSWVHFSSNYTAMAACHVTSAPSSDTSCQNGYTAIILLLHLSHTGVQHMPSDLIGKSAREKPLIARETDICICCSHTVRFQSKVYQAKSAFPIQNRRTHWSKNKYITAIGQSDSSLASVQKIKWLICHHMGELLYFIQSGSHIELQVSLSENRVQVKKTEWK